MAMTAAERKRASRARMVRGTSDGVERVLVNGRAYMPRHGQAYGVTYAVQRDGSVFYVKRAGQARTRNTLHTCQAPSFNDAYADGGGRCHDRAQHVSSVVRVSSASTIHALHGAQGWYPDGQPASTRKGGKAARLERIRYPYRAHERPMAGGDGGFGSVLPHMGVCVHRIGCADCCDRDHARVGAR